MYAQTRLGSSVNSSPQSDGNDSHYGTPGTKLTEFSPEDVRSEQKLRPGNDFRTPQPPAFALRAKSGSTTPLFKVEKPIGPDPFTSLKHGSQMGSPFNGPRLSAKAASFKPQTFNVDSKGCGIAGVYAEIRATREGESAATPVTSFEQMNTSPLVDTGSYFQRDRSSNGSSSIGGILLPPSESPVSGIPSLDSLALAPSFTNDFSSNGNTRYLRITGVDNTLGVDKLNTAFQGITFGLPNLVVVSQLDQGIIFLAFTDVRDAWKASFELPRTQLGWAAEFLKPKDFSRTMNANYGSSASNCEGQLAISATFQGSRESFDPSYITVLLSDLVQVYGDVLAQKILYKSFPIVRVRVEYFDLQVSSRVKKLDNLSVGEIRISVEDFAPDLGWNQNDHTKFDEPLVIGQDEGEIETLVGGMTINSISEQSSPAKASETTSPVGRFQLTPTECESNLVPYTFGTTPSFQQSQILTTPLSQSTLSSMPIIPPAPMGLRLAPTQLQPSRASSPPSYERRRRITGSGLNNNNKVDIEKIRRGGDVRTTEIMLRNIPNKMDQATLKEIVDETNRGEYDFMYLRIDFANNCNVGYAFINFVDPLAIIPFYQARAGRRWNKYKSHKEAEVSYATIQGRDCLVQKFRNSSVMLEHPSFRPKVFHTGGGPLAGEEDAFPEPDNRSKMRRSVENAAQVGLFAPRAGQQFRDEQRRRRSQFDRGTRLAEIEDSSQLNHQDGLQYAAVIGHANSAAGFHIQSNSRPV